MLNFKNENMSTKGSKTIPISEPNDNKKKGSENVEADSKMENQRGDNGADTENGKHDETTEKLLKNINELKDQLLRKTAELDNVIKRTAKEKMELIDYANEKLILKMLNVVDDIANAVEAGNKTKDYDSLMKGIELIYNKVNKLLEEEGVKQIESPVGKPFDVNLHEAMMSIPSEMEEGSVVQEMFPGYSLRGKVIRHSKVITSSGEPN